jgi:hypothetical protein
MYTTSLEPARVIDRAVVTDVYHVLNCRAPILDEDLGAVRAIEDRPSAFNKSKGAYR